MKSKCLLLMAGLLLLISCKKVTADFTYNPSEPVAGQVVTFTFMGEGADKFEWRFGDLTTGENASAPHIYKKPGTYTVELVCWEKKISKKYCSKTITVRDTIPSIELSVDSLVNGFEVFTAYARVYNPWSRKLKYEWQIDGDKLVVLDDGRLDLAAFRAYYRRQNCLDTIRLHLTMDASQTSPEQHFNLMLPIQISNHPSTAVLYETATSDIYAQRLYRIENQWVYEGQIMASARQKTLVTEEQDTLCVDGQDTIRIADMCSKTGHEVLGFQMDKWTRKLYFRSQTGVGVCNMNGSHVRLLSPVMANGLKVDVVGNRLYWADGTGMSYCPLFRLSDNSDRVNTKRVNEVSNIVKISVDNEAH